MPAAKRSLPPALTEGGAGLLHAGASGASRRSGEARKPVMQVVGLNRFALDESFFLHTGEDQRPECGDGFDVTLSDGVHKLKCALSTALNQLVYRGWLQLHTLVRVESWRNILDERALESSVRLVVVTGLCSADSTGAAGDTEGDYTAHFGEISPPGAGLSWLPAVVAPDDEPETALTLPCPLLGKRKHYLHLESNDVLLTDLWAAQTLGNWEWVSGAMAAPGGDEDGEAQRPDFDQLPTLSAALRSEEAEESQVQRHPNRPGPSSAGASSSSASANGGRNVGGRPARRGPPPDLLGRVVQKMPLRFFGRLSEERPLDYAVYYTLVLKDASTRPEAEGTQVTLWNRMCELSYEAVEVGDVLLVKDYKWSKRFLESGDPSKGFVWEASVNTKKPAGQLRKLTSHEASQLATVGGAARLRDLPDPELKTRQAMLAMFVPGGGAPPADETADVLGVVLRVLPVHRRRRDAEQERSGQVSFERARWLLLLTRGDGGDDDPQEVPVLLNAADCGQSRFDALDQSLHQKVLLRGLRLQGFVDGGSGSGGGGAAQPPSLWLRSGARTRVQTGDAIPETVDHGEYDAVFGWCTDEARSRRGAPPPPPPRAPPVERTPAPLAALLGKRLPPLATLRQSFPDWERKQVLLRELAGAAAALHVRELRPCLVQAYLVPREADAQLQLQQSCADAPEGGLLLRASLRPLNPVGAGGSGDGGAGTDVPEVVAHLCDADGAGQGGGLWLSLWRCAAVAAGQQPRLNVPKCTRRSLATTLSKLKSAPLVLAIDLYKPTNKPGFAELVAVHTPSA